MAVTTVLVISDAHNQAIYEPSCEAYKHLGQTSNYYWIDPDGSGPLGPLKVYCNMTEDKVWTIVSHDLQMQTTVVGYSPEKYSVTQLIYSASMDQISAITSSAEYCEQYVSYFCRMSRLLNTPELHIQTSSEALELLRYSGLRIDRRAELMRLS
ncbi:hypothetical protein ACRRTK_015960 [Alexandromys fortis]